MNKYLNEYSIGDNLDLLKELEDETIDLVYMDPPFNTGRDFGDYKDNWSSNMEFSKFIRERAVEIRRILKKTGTVVVHIDPKTSAYVRLAFDEIFGFKNFLNEIVWITGGNAKTKNVIPRFHDSILIYRKSSRQKFNLLYFPYDESYFERNKPKFDENKKMHYITTAAYNSQPDVNPRMNLRYEWNGHEKQWYFSKEKIQELHDDERLEYNGRGVPRVKRFIEEMDGIPLRDVWTDISNVQNGEKMNYATQKPVKLLERIINLYTHEGDVVLDPFAGSGTTGRGAINTNRDFILFDINKDGKKIFKKSIKDKQRKKGV